MYFKDVLDCGYNRFTWWRIHLVLRGLFPPQSFNHSSGEFITAVLQCHIWEVLELLDSSTDIPNNSLHILYM